MSGNVISDILDSAINAIVSPLTSNLPHIKRVYLARMEYNGSEEDLTIQYRTESGETYKSVADDYFVEPSVLVRSNRSIEIDEELDAGSRVRIEITQRDLQLIPAEYAEVGETLFLVVETENFRSDDEGNPRKIRVQLMNGPDSVLGAADSPLEFSHEGEQKDQVDIEVGQLLVSSDFTNKDEFQDFAIARITLSGNMESKQQWLKEIGNIDDESARYAPIYFKADAHTINSDIPELLFSYYGEVDGQQNSDKFWYGDGRYFELDNTGAPWMTKAIKDGRTFSGAVETDEIVRQRIDEHYFPICGRGLTSPSNWCAAFVSYMLYQSSFSNPLNAGSVQFGSSSKMVQIDRPVYGAISVWQNYVKSDDVGTFEARGLSGLTRGTIRFDGVEYRKIFRGHVGFVFGIRAGSAEGKYLILGGNQKNKVMVREYDCTGTAFRHILARGFYGKRKHIGFFIPEDYALSMQDGLDSASTDLESRTHWLNDHTYSNFTEANLAATGLAMDAQGANIDT